MANKLKDSIPEFGWGHIDFHLFQGPGNVITTNIYNPVNVLNYANLVFIETTSTETNNIDPRK